MTLHYRSRLLLVFLFSLLANTTSFSQIITTVAGNGTNSSCGDGGPATNACVQPVEVAVDAAGNLYIASSLSIRKVNSSGIINTIAGSTAGTGGDGGPAVNAQFTNIRAMAFDASGNLYICDGHRIRKISTAGIITTIAGSTLSGFAGDNGPATSALFYNPADIAINASGNIFIADSDNKRIRKINTAGVITSIAGNGISGYSDGIATQSMLSSSWGIAVDAAGNVYISDLGNNRLRKVSTSGMLSTICGTGLPYPDGDGGFAINSHASYPLAMAIDAGGNLFFSTDNRVRFIRPDGKIYTYAGNGSVVNGFSGDGGLATSALMMYPSGIAFDAANNLYIADRQNYRVRKVSMCTAPPAQPAPITGSAHPCPLSSHTYSVPQGTNTTYYEWTLPSGWTYPSGWPIPNFTNGDSIITNTSTNGGTITVTANNLCGASPVQVLATPINDTPLAQIYPLADYYTLCAGEYLTLSGTAGVGYTYNWYSNTSFGTPYSTSPTVQINGSGFTDNTCLKIVDAEGCAGRYCVGQQMPMVRIDNFISPQTICQGDSFMMVAVTNSDTMYNIQWKKNGANLPGATNDTFYATQTGTYTIAAVNDQCDLFFPATSIMDLTVIDTPTFTVTASGPLTFCSGGSVTFNVSNLSFGSLTWYKDGNLLPGLYPYTMNSSGLYSVVANNTCTSTKYFTVVSDTVVATASWPGTASVCYGETVLLTANTGTGYTYQWKVNNVDIPGAIMPSYTATSSGAYTVTIDDGLCSDLSNDVNVVVSTMQADLTAGGPTTFCDGGNVLLTANTGQWYTYQWLQDGNNLGNTANTYTADQSGLYSVIISYGDCLDTAQVAVTETPFPVVAIAQNGTELSVPGGYNSYQWYVNGAAISGANSETYNATQDGDYYVVVSNGCEGQSNTLTLFLAVNNITTPKNTILIHPNPFSDQATLTFTNAHHKRHNFKLYNVQGQLVRETGNITGSELKIERGSLPAGMYYYQLYKEQSIVGSGKLVVQ